jgi:hypothetical protein
MFLGHFGVAFAAKKALPKTSLRLLVFAAQFADLLWPILLLAGVERVRMVPGLMAASPFDFTRYPVSHSLVMQFVWGALIALICFALHRNARSALILGSLVPTHWVLDFIAHRPDMPLYPSGPKYGLGMWNSIPLTIAVEYVLFAAGITIYLSATRAKGATGKWGFWSLIVLLGVLFPVALFGPPPPNVHALAWSALIMWITVPWAAWADRHRQPAME